MKASEIFKKSLYRYSSEEIKDGKHVVVMSEITGFTGSCKVVLDLNGKVVEDMEVALTER